MADSLFRTHGLHTGPFARRAKVPWKECNQMDERLKFIARLLDGEKMAVVCRLFGISRKTGYKILTRYNEIGLEGLTDRSRRPYRQANQLPVQIETRIVRLKQARPEDVDTEGEDHAPDELRYACMSRPWVSAGRVVPLRSSRTKVFLIAAAHRVSLNDLWPDAGA